MPDPGLLNALPSDDDFVLAAQVYGHPPSGMKGGGVRERTDELIVSHANVGVPQAGPTLPTPLKPRIRDDRIRAYRSCDYELDA